MESFILFYEKCRLCLDKPGKQEIFQSEDLPQVILQCIGVKVKRSDNLPQKICSYCLKIVNDAKELRIIAKKNDDHLRSLFHANSPDNSDMSEEDSDRLVIAESSTEATPEKHPNKKAKRKETNEVQKSPTSNKGIKVRKDLFESQKASLSIQAPADSVSSVRSKSSQSDQKELRCEICDKVFDKWKKLYLHRRFHNKKLSCPLDGCGKMFATKGDLERHLRIHTGVKPYHCDVCGQSFTQNGTLKSHMKTLHRDLVECDVPVH